MAAPGHPSRGPSTIRGPPPHMQSCPVCPFISRILVRPLLLWSPCLQLLPPPSGKPALTNCLEMQTLLNSLAITYGFPNKPVSSQGARIGSCLSPNLRLLVGEGEDGK